MNKKRLTSVTLPGVGGDLLLLRLPLLVVAFGLPPEAVQCTSERRHCHDLQM